jgi:hypothetical protein
MRTDKETKKRGRSGSPGCRDPIGGIGVVSPTKEKKSGSMGDVDLDFGRDLGVGSRATTSPRSTDISKSPSDTARLASSAEKLGISVSPPSSRGGSGRGLKLCVASVGWIEKKAGVVSFI